MIPHNAVCLIEVARRSASVHTPTPFAPPKSWQHWSRSRRACDGANSTYNIRVGRSRNPTGPYLDNMGIPLLKGGNL
ncbi:MAG: hypothetical protein WBW33_03995 [Bryobacteraceae bacterium]